jgi:hypothetical protein
LITDADGKRSSALYVIGVPGAIRRAHTPTTPDEAAAASASSD